MKKILLLSPHLDDAILSCGPYIIDNVKKGNAVSIATVFTGSIDPKKHSPLAKWFHGICGLSDNAVEVRCLEDKKACSYLNAACIHLGMPECLYRYNSDECPKYQNDWNIFHTNIEKELDTVAQLINILSSKLQINQFNEILIPLGIGRHIDHLIVRKAVEALMNEPHLLNCKIFYYQDTPYVCEDTDTTWEKDLTSNLTPKLYTFPLKHFNIYIRSISLYKSQVIMLWQNRQEMLMQLSRYYQKTNSKTIKAVIWQ